jgi:hypothetical protein
MLEREEKIQVYSLKKGMSFEDTGVNLVMILKLAKEKYGFGCGYFNLG